MSETTYLGDGLTASFDGWHIWLKTPAGNEIALEPSVFAALVTYRQRLTGEANRRYDEERDRHRGASGG